MKQKWSFGHDNFPHETIENAENFMRVVRWGVWRKKRDVFGTTYKFLLYVIFL